MKGRLTQSGRYPCGPKGFGMFANGALRLPGWARLRRRQMEEIADRVALLQQRTGPDPPASPSP